MNTPEEKTFEHDIAEFGQDFYKKRYEAALQSSSEKDARIALLEEALRELYQLVESGVLVRDISKDHENGWSMKMLDLIRVLKKIGISPILYKRERITLWNRE